MQGVRFVTLEVAHRLIGLTVAAMRSKIERGQWAEGKEYRRGPDGRIYVDLSGYEKWVQGG